MIVMYLCEYLRHDKLVFRHEVVYIALIFNTQECMNCKLKNVKVRMASYSKNESSAHYKIRAIIYQSILAEFFKEEY